MNTKNQVKLREEFMKRMRGIPADVVARAMDKNTPGVTWYGCSKSLMANYWSYDKIEAHGRGVANLDKVYEDCQELMRRAAHDSRVT
jgi:hypothetical protein